MTCRFTAAAAADLNSILRHTRIQFGIEQQRRYAALFDVAFAMIDADPDRPGALFRGQLRDGVQAIHLDHAARRKGAASHLVFYVKRGEADVLVLRILHERMKPARHLARRLHD